LTGYSLDTIDNSLHLYNTEWRFFLMNKTKMKIPDDWTFKSQDIAAHFDQHVKEQLPWYDLITKVIVCIARHYIESNGLVYDIGCSTGNITGAIY